MVGTSDGVLGLLAAGVGGEKSGTFGLHTMRVDATIMAAASIVPGLALTEVSIASHCDDMVSGITYGAYWRRSRTLVFLKT
jgi:hypothetical protein